MVEGLEREWTVEACPCPYDRCRAAVIGSKGGPPVTVGQGTIDRDVAEHIVGLHNKDLAAKQAAALGES